MSWKKIGRIFNSNGHSPLMFTHAQNPQAVYLYDDVFRVFFSSRDEQNRSSIFYVDINLSNPKEIIEVATSPVVSFGTLGHFDDSGVTHGHLVNFQGKFWLYYLGWNLGVTVPWRNSIGLCVSKSLDGPFEKISQAPILDRSAVDPFSLSYPFVIPGADQWEMIYGSNLTWGAAKSDMHHVLKRAISHDGIHWSPTGEIVMSLDQNMEVGISRPWIQNINGNIKLFYCYRNDIYRIGSAVREGEVRWRRDVDDEILPSADSWDSEMVCYPSIFSHKNRFFLLYCGNSYGKTGFGLAEWI